MGVPSVKEMCCNGWTSSSRTAELQWDRKQSDRPWALSYCFPCAIYVSAADHKHLLGTVCSYLLTRQLPCLMWWMTMVWLLASFAFCSRFQPVVVPEPTVEETYEILQGLRERYEAHHKLRYTDDALMAAAKYSSQYISDRFLPDKAIDLIDEAGSRVRLRHIQLPEEARDLDKELKQVGVGGWCGKVAVVDQQLEMIVMLVLWMISRLLDVPCLDQMFIWSYVHTVVLDVMSRCQGASRQ